MKHRIEMEQQKLREQLAEQQQAAPDAVEQDQVETAEFEDEDDEVEDIDDIDDAPAMVADDARAQTGSKQDT